MRVCLRGREGNVWLWNERCKVLGKCDHDERCNHTCNVLFPLRTLGCVLIFFTDIGDVSLLDPYGISMLLITLKEAHLTNQPTSNSCEIFYYYSWGLHEHYSGGIEWNLRAIQWILSVRENLLNKYSPQKKSKAQVKNNNLSMKCNVDTLDSLYRWE